MAVDLVVTIHGSSGLIQTTSATPVASGAFFRLDTGKHDGTVTYKLVAVVRLSSSAQTGTIEIQPSGGGTNIGTATHTGNTLDTRIEGTITPTAGNNVYDLYRSVTGGATFTVLSWHIEITQIGATKTEYDIPLVGNSANATAGPTEQVHSSRFLYTAANWNNATFVLVTRGNQGGSGTLTVDLFDGTSVVGSTTHSSGTNDFQESTGLTLTDGAEHIARGTASSGTDVVAWAALRVTLSTIDKCEIHHKVGLRRATNAVDWTNAATATTVNCVAGRRIVTTAGFSASFIQAMYFEAVALSAAADDTVILKKDGSNDSGSAGTTVSTLTITSGSKQRLRSADLLSGWANERYYAALVKSANAGTADAYTASVIFVLIAPAGGAVARREGPTRGLHRGLAA